jgi:hypothetical protein
MESCASDKARVSDKAHRVAVAGGGMWHDVLLIRPTGCRVGCASDKAHRMACGCASDKECVSGKAHRMACASDKAHRVAGACDF